MKYGPNNQELLKKLIQEVSLGKFDNFHQFLQLKTDHVLRLSFGIARGANLVRLGEALAGSDITELHLGYNAINDGQLLNFPETLKHTNLKYINLENNDISDCGAIKFIQKLADTDIIKLNLWDNRISADGTQLIARELPITKLMTLFLNTYNSAVLISPKLWGNVKKYFFHPISIASLNSMSSEKKASIMNMHNTQAECQGKMLHDFFCGIFVSLPIELQSHVLSFLPLMHHQIANRCLAIASPLNSMDENKIAQSCVTAASLK